MATSHAKGHGGGVFEGEDGEARQLLPHLRRVAAVVEA